MSGLTTQLNRDVAELKEELEAVRRERDAAKRQLLGLDHVIQAKKMLAGAQHPVGPLVLVSGAASRALHSGDVLDGLAKCIFHGRLRLDSVQLIYTGDVVKNLLMNMTNSFQWSTPVKTMFAAGHALGRKAVEVIAGRARPLTGRPGNIDDLVNERCFNLLVPSPATLNKRTKEISNCKGQPGQTYEERIGFLQQGFDQLEASCVLENQIALKEGRQSRPKLLRLGWDATDLMALLKILKDGQFVGDCMMQHTCPDTMFSTAGAGNVEELQALFQSLVGPVGEALARRSSNSFQADAKAALVAVKDFLDSDDNGIPALERILEVQAANLEARELLYTTK